LTRAYSIHGNRINLISSIFRISACLLFGFGLGKILISVFALFFALEMAIALT
jgi:hypothetical protein